jgi:GT2 family glycosyltransferase
MPGIGLIFATAARPEPLAETLRSLAGVRLPGGHPVDLIVVENVAQQGAEKLLRALPPGRFSAVRYLFEPARGKSRALNRALAAASGDILLFSDDDVRFPSDWIERMIAPIAAGRADAVAGGVRLAPHLLRPWMTGRHRAWLASTSDYLKADDPSEMCGANMAVSRRALDLVGGFDPELGPGITGGGEESLLSWQLRRAGLRIAGALDVEVEHHPDPDRLRYRHWLKAAAGKGEAHAYQIHHWWHRPVHFARLRQIYLAAKLGVRRLATPRRSPDDEGIAPWELSYVEEHAFYARSIRERHRPRNYSPNGLRHREHLGHAP